MDDRQSKTYTIASHSESYEVKPILTFYTAVRDFMGEEKLNIALLLEDAETGEGYTAVTTNLGEFISVRNAAYIDTNNNPGIDRWLEQNGIAKMTGLTKQSGYCTYPLAVFTDEFVRDNDKFLIADYHRQFDFAANRREDTDAVCFGGDTATERQYAESFGIATPEHTRKKRTYKVTITETLKRTVKVKANSEDEAHQMVEDGWKNEVHVLDADDFKEVHFTVSERQPDRGLSR
jgi:hypothetical protein